jgi:uncharacterized membrane protein
MSASMSAPTAQPRRPALTIALGLILTVYLCARILEVVPGSIPLTSIVALNILSALAFVLVEGSRDYGLRGILAFAAICLLVFNFSESLIVAADSPFGHADFAGLVGPRLFHVPVLLGLAYVGMGYASWTLARMMMGGPYVTAPGARMFSLSLIAALAMTAWDFAEDPVWTTILRNWARRDGGPSSTVPISDFFGWLATAFVIFWFFALYLQRRRSPRVGTPQPSLSPALLLYASCTAGNLLEALSTRNSDIALYPAGNPWWTTEIKASAALLPVLVMGTFVVVAWARLAKEEKPSRN